MQDTTKRDDSYSCQPNIMSFNPELELKSTVLSSDETYTVQEAVNSFGFGLFHVKLSLIVGLCWMADSMEITILSIIGPAMICEFNISKYEQAFTTTIVFVGMILSSTFWTKLSDRYGRKPTLILCGVLLVLYNLLSSVALSFGWLIILRGLVGFAIGCVPQSVTLYAEFLPTKHKGKCVVLMDCFWALGACFEVTLALVVFPILGWRWLLGLSATPLLLFTALTPWLTESPRFHAMNGRNDKAYRVLNQIATSNRKHMLSGRLATDFQTQSSRSVGALLKPGLRRTTVLLWFVWIACAFCYYGLVLISTELIFFKYKEQQAFDSSCEPFDTMDFMDLLWITLSEFPGIFLTIAVFERFGKKETMVSQFLAFAGCILLLNVKGGRFYRISILFIARGVISGLFQSVYTYTPEVYPATLRSIGVSGCSTFARIGAMATPFVAQVLLQTSVWKVFAIYSAIACGAAFACAWLPNKATGIF